MMLSVGVSPMTDRTVTTTAAATRSVDPDSASVVITAIGEAPSAARAREHARDRAVTVRTAVEAVTEVTIETVDKRVTNAAATFDPDTDAAFRAVEEFHARCQPEMAAAVVVEATDAGGTVDRVAYELTEMTRAEEQDAALTAAVDRARRKAERVATAEGLAVGTAQQITTKPERPGEATVVDDAWESDPAVHPAPISVTERVEVSYELVESEE
ncbi:MAG: SIMPL domain-containing protein [Bacteroidales bacterium]|nr:SIMPL domain-containing protein [Bacteroidales bacterium]